MIGSSSPHRAVWRLARARLAVAVVAAVAGSEDAFRDLVVQYQGRVRALIRRIVRDPSRSEELAQDTFVKAYQQLHTFDPTRRFASWLLTIAHHRAIDELRRRRVVTEPLDETIDRHAGIVDPGEDGPVSRLERADVARLVEAAMRRLRPEWVELLTLRYEHDLDLAEIAEITGMPVGTVKSSLHRARLAMAVALRETGWRETP